MEVDGWMGVCDGCETDKATDGQKDRPTGTGQVTDYHLLTDRLDFVALALRTSVPIPGSPGLWRWYFQDRDDRRWMARKTVINSGTPISVQPTIHLEAKKRKED